MPNQEIHVLHFTENERQLLGALLDELTLSQRIAISTVLEKAEKRSMEATASEPDPQVEEKPTQNEQIAPEA